MNNPQNRFIIPIKIDFSTICQLNILIKIVNWKKTKQKKLMINLDECIALVSLWTNHRPIIPIIINYFKIFQ